MAKPRISLTVGIAEDGKATVLYIGGDATAAQKAFADAILGKDLAEVQLCKFIEPSRRKSTGVEIASGTSEAREAAKAAAAKDARAEGPHALAAKLAGQAVEARNIALRARSTAKAAKDAGVPDYDDLEKKATAAEATAQKAAEKSAEAAKAAKLASAAKAPEKTK